MTQSFQAIYEQGVLRPLKAVDLKEHEVVSLAILGRGSSGAGTSEEQGILRQRELLLAFAAKMESLPDDSPRDGLTNRDHDRLIYGS